MAKEELEEAKALLEQIGWMLIIDWDPIGVRHDVAKVKDEYDRVAAKPGRGYGIPVPGNLRDLPVGDDAVSF